MATLHLPPLRQRGQVEGRCGYITSTIHHHAPHSSVIIPLMANPQVPSNTGSAKIDQQGHTSNGMHGDVGRATDSKRGTPSPESIKTTRG